jgi:hypothetical protein
MERAWMERAWMERAWMERCDGSFPTERRSYSRCCSGKVILSEREFGGFVIVVRGCLPFDFSIEEMVDHDL